MLPHPDSLALPLKEGMRDLRSSIRCEARDGAVSRRFLGLPHPTRQLARLADGVLTQAEGLAIRLLPRQAAGLDAALDGLGALLRGGARPGARPADLFALARHALDLEGTCGVVVSELRLATHAAGPRTPPGADCVEAAAAAAAWTAGIGMVRPCLSTVLAHGQRARSERIDRHLALVVWLAVLVRLDSSAEASRCLGGAHAAVDAEGADWSALLRAGRHGELAHAWRQTVPYLP